VDELPHTVCLTQFANKSVADGQMGRWALDSLGDVLKIISLGFKKSQRSVMHDFHSYLLTYLLTLDLAVCMWVPNYEPSPI